MRFEDQGPKVIMVGNSSVGKTALLVRLRDNDFSDVQSPTVGGFSARITFNLGTLQKPKTFFFQLWDTAGQERYRSLTPVYSRDAHCVLLIYDLTSGASFRAIPEWFDLVKVNTHPKCKYLIVASKSDLAGAREVPDTEGEQLQEKLKAEAFVTVSAKLGTGMDSLVRSIQLAVEQIQEIPLMPIEVPLDQPPNKRSCC
jgi:small GTP-binding protein